MVYLVCNNCISIVLLQSDVEVEGGSMNNPDKVVSSINQLYDLETPPNKEILDT